MTSLKEKINRIRDEQADETLDAMLAASAQRNQQRAFIALGALGAFDNLARTLSAQVIRGLDAFREAKLHESLGFPHFDDFLRESQYSPVSKSQFYERRKVLEQEGDAIFDILNGLSVPISKRKLIGRGSLAIEGDNLILKSEGEEIEISLRDRTRIVETISSLADKTFELDKKLKKQTAVKAANPAQEENPYSAALVNLVSAFTAFDLHAGKLAPHEKETLAPKAFELIAAQMERLSESFGRKVWNEDFHARAPELNDEELAALI